LAGVIEKKYKIKPVLIEGSGGVFEVTLDDTLIFSKKKEGRFPENDEILKLIAGNVRS
jgi:selenoprotein W-related protein